MKLIRADVLKNELLRKWVRNIAMVDEFIEGLPGYGDSEPERKKGRWNFIGDNLFECTCCSVVYSTQQLNGLRNYNTDPYAPRFCPNCGAKMEGEKDG